MKRILVHVAAIALSLSLAAVPLHAETRLIVRDVLGLNALKLNCLVLNCRVLQGLGDPDGDLFVVTSPLPVPMLVPALLGAVGVRAVEVDQVVDVQGGATAVAAPPWLYDREPRNFYGTTVWNGYLAQPAASIVKAAAARNAEGVTGEGVIVAVIDTGVDPAHPVLANVLLPNGYDFTRNQSGADERGDVSQSTVAVVDRRSPSRVNQSTVAVVDQSTVAVVDGDSRDGFGHGTMVSGIVHLVAPRAKILPLKAFGVDGRGYASDVLRAIYYAQRNRAKVINMSFSFTSSSAEMGLAISYVSARGVICVASAGNEGTDARRYPAALSNVIGVGSTTDYDGQSTFSNYGSANVWVAAPGEGVMTTYPFGTWAAAWGTSFSAPLVSGAAALLADVSGSLNVSTAASALANGEFAGAGMNHGRIDALDAVKWWDSKTGR
jgi:subtilisin family serine protease